MSVCAKIGSGRTMSNGKRSIADRWLESEFRNWLFVFVSLLVVSTCLLFSTQLIIDAVLLIMFSCIAIQHVIEIIEKRVRR